MLAAKAFAVLSIAYGLDYNLMIDLPAVLTLAAYHYQFETKKKLVTV